MPKQIKKESMKPCDRKYRICAVAGMAVSVVFAPIAIILLKNLVETEGKVAATLLFAAYWIYLISCVISLVFGVKAYTKEDNVADLFQGLFEVYAIIACFMNMRFMFVMLFSAFESHWADALLGSLTESEFITSQFASWVCLAIAVVVTFVLGILAIVKLANNRKK